MATQYQPQPNEKSEVTIEDGNEHRTVAPGEYATGFKLAAILSGLCLSFFGASLDTTVLGEEHLLSNPKLYASLFLTYCSHSNSEDH